MKKGGWRIVFVSLIFLGLIVLFFLPVVAHPGSVLPAFRSTDESYAAVWDFWRIKFSLRNGLPLLKSDYVRYPFGIDNTRNVSYLWFYLNLLLTRLTNHIATYNIQVLSNFFLSAIFMYLLVYYLTGSQFASIVSGTMFSFCPFHFARAWQHLSLTYIQPFPITFLILFVLLDNLSVRNSLLLLLGILITVPIDGYMNIMLVLSVVIYLFYICWHSLKEKSAAQKVRYKKYILRVLILGVIGAIMVSPQYLIYIVNIFLPIKSAGFAHNPFCRQFIDLFAQSAKPLSYFLPSTEHPIFGRFTEGFVGTSLWGVSYTEHQLYLGWTTILLAVIALKKRFGTAKRKITVWKEHDNFYITFFALLAVSAWFFSQPPWWQIGRFKILMPSFFMYKVLPMFRAYCRFGIVVMFAVAVLAGFGLKFILERFKSQKVKVAVTALCCGLVLFEFWNWPSYKVIDVSKAPAVYYWLKAQPREAVIAEYPLDAIGPNELYKLYQTTHEKKMINGAVPGTPAHKNMQRLVDLSQPKTAAALEAMGVRYVLVHRADYLKTELVEDRRQLEKIPVNRGLKLVRSFPAEACPDRRIRCIAESGQVDVYEVVTQPLNEAKRSGR
jgi:hypothetical protein